MNLVLKFGSKIKIMIFCQLSDIGFANGTKLSLNSAVLRRIEAFRNKDKNKPLCEICAAIFYDELNSLKERAAIQCEASQKLYLSNRKTFNI